MTTSPMELHELGELLDELSEDSDVEGTPAVAAEAGKAAAAPEAAEFELPTADQATHGAHDSALPANASLTAQPPVGMQSANASDRLIGEESSPPSNRKPEAVAVDPPPLGDGVWMGEIVAESDAPPAAETAPTINESGGGEEGEPHEEDDGEEGEECPADLLLPTPPSHSPVIFGSNAKPGPAGPRGSASDDERARDELRRFYRGMSGSGSSDSVEYITDSGSEHGGDKEEEEEPPGRSLSPPPPLPSPDLGADLAGHVADADGNVHRSITPPPLPPLPLPPGDALQVPRAGPGFSAAEDVDGDQDQDEDQDESAGPLVGVGKGTSFVSPNADAMDDEGLPSAPQRVPTPPPDDVQEHPSGNSHGDEDANATPPDLPPSIKAQVSLSDLEGDQVIPAMPLSPPFARKGGSTGASDGGADGAGSDSEQAPRGLEFEVDDDLEALDAESPPKATDAKQLPLPTHLPLGDGASFGGGDDGDNDNGDGRGGGNDPNTQPQPPPLPPLPPAAAMSGLTPKERIELRERRLHALRKAATDQAVHENRIARNRYRTRLHGIVSREAARRFCLSRDAARWRAAHAELSQQGMQPPPPDPSRKWGRGPEDDRIAKRLANVPFEQWGSLFRAFGADAPREPSSKCQAGDETFNKALELQCKYRSPVSGMASNTPPVLNAAQQHGMASRLQAPVVDGQLVHDYLAVVLSGHNPSPRVRDAVWQVPEIVGLEGEVYVGEYAIGHTAAAFPTVMSDLAAQMLDFWEPDRNTPELALQRVRKDVRDYENLLLRWCLWRYPLLRTVEVDMDIPGQACEATLGVRPLCQTCATKKISHRAVLLVYERIQRTMDSVFLRVLLPFYVMVHGTKDAALAAKCEQLASLGDEVLFDMLGLRKLLWLEADLIIGDGASRATPYYKAIRQLQAAMNLERGVLPLEQLCELVDVLKWACDAPRAWYSKPRTSLDVAGVIEHAAVPEDDETLVVGGDDLLPIIAFVLIRAGRSVHHDLGARLALLDDFSPPGIQEGEVGYALILLMSAMEVVHRQEMPADLNSAAGDDHQV